MSKNFMMNDLCSCQELNILSGRQQTSEYHSIRKKIMQFPPVNEKYLSRTWSHKGACRNVLILLMPLSLYTIICYRNVLKKAIWNKNLFLELIFVTAGRERMSGPALMKVVITIRVHSHLPRTLQYSNGLKRHVDQTHKE